MLAIADEIKPEGSAISLRKGVNTSLLKFYIVENNWLTIIITFVFMISRSNKIIVMVEGCHFTDSGRY